MKKFWEILGILFLLGLAGAGGYFLAYKKIESLRPVQNNIENIEQKDNEETENENKVEKEEIQKPAKNADYIFLKETENEITLNNEKHVLLTYYYEDKSALEEDNVAYSLVKEVYFDGHKLFDNEFVTQKLAFNELKYAIVEDENILMNNTFIKDSSSNEEYYIYFRKVGFDVADTINAYIIDKNGNLITDLLAKSSLSEAHVFVNDNNIGDRNYEVKDGKKVLYSNFKIDIHEKFIYYLTMKCSTKEYLAEYKLIIKNGKIETTKVRDYLDENHEPLYGEVQIIGQSC